MPQLVKGGKHAYGWTRVGEMGRIRVPPEAVAEYGFEDPSKLLILSGSKTSGGFGLAFRDLFSRTPMAAVLHTYPELADF
jgi:hypothetical protein